MTNKSTNSANSYQIGGAHYQAPIQHWDYVWANNMDYFQGQITKYVTRWKDKNGLDDLHKARHFLDKYIELVERSLPEQPDSGEPGRGYVSQD